MSREEYLSNFTPLKLPVPAKFGGRTMCHRRTQRFEDEIPVAVIDSLMFSLRLPGSKNKVT